ncbi:type II toxin-antitoxin system RelE/ParE family toxin [Thiocapsa bogorovii]|nr:type II toxin-antitoxin system RelE/ParE family toxin [Thiocapsa bogorovii]UHD16872.1 type II toxin-antitoxin system RelE/ParE family toxin [Thiocapsa bogorovii]
MERVKSRLEFKNADPSGELEVGLFPDNPLEALSGDRTGQYSVRINDQWRICFHWTDQVPKDVEMIDDH